MPPVTFSPLVNTCDVLILRCVNISISKIKCLKIALVNPELENIFELAVPLFNSKPLDLALPICGIVTPVVDCCVPLVTVAVLNRLTFLNASTSPETNPISGEPNTFVTLTKFSISNLVLLLFCVSKSLAFSISTNVVPIVSISYPFT